MKHLCLYFQVHQPFRLRRYRFFEIGNNNYYYDDYTNEMILNKVAEKCYLPANKILLDLIKKHKGEFKVSFSISGIALDQFELYAPKVLDSFKELANTGCVEFLAETEAHSLVSLSSDEQFKLQVDKHVQKIKKYFNQTPVVFRNTELIYSDDIGKVVADMGFKAILTEGAKHILGWKSPNFMYCNSINPRLKILLKNFKLSDDIAFRFGNKTWAEYPLTTDKYVKWLNQLNPKEETINLFMDYETFGEHQWKDTGIFDFLKAFPDTVFKKSKITFATPSELVEKLQPVSSIQVPYPISWADNERDVTAWLGNELQQDAFNKLYLLNEKIGSISDKDLLQDWLYLQSSDHFYYMCTKYFSDGEVHSYFNPYDSPYDAFINYMNVLADFTNRVNSQSPVTNKDQEIANLLRVISEQQVQIDELENKLIGTDTSSISKPKKTNRNAAEKKTPKTQVKRKPAVKKIRK